MLIADPYSIPLLADSIDIIRWFLCELLAEDPQLVSPHSFLKSGQAMMLSMKDSQDNSLEQTNQATYAHHRSGYVALVGRPNAGKSTLLNALVGHHLSIVTPRPQTTRHRILGIYDRSDCQILFIDTPGLVKPRDAMHEFMTGEAQRALADADVVVLLIDAIKGPGAREKAILTGPLAEVEPESLLILCNKMDRLPPPKVVQLQEALKALELPDEIEIVYASALHGSGLEDLLQAIEKRLPLGPKYYGGTDGEGGSIPLTDRSERFSVAELIREQAYQRLRDEVPHEIAVAVRQMKDDPDRHKVFIEADIVVERDSQRGILIGKKGARLKEIGQEARLTIEEMLGRPVYLSLRVTVSPGWRKNPRLLKELGYDPGTVY